VSHRPNFLLGPKPSSMAAVGERDAMVVINRLLVPVSGEQGGLEVAMSMVVGTGWCGW
jgi:hypothetical protein